VEITAAFALSSSG